MTQSIDAAEWVRRCVAQMLLLDPALDPDLARPLAEDMHTRDRWRNLGPEGAAVAVFDIGQSAPRKDV